MKKKLFIVAKILVSSGLVWWLVVSVDWAQVWQLAQSAHRGFLLAFVALYLTAIVLSAYRWMILARATGFDNPLWFYIRTYFTGTFFNNFFPSFVGGDTYRVLALGTPTHRIASASQTVIADRITGFHVILALATIFGIGILDSIAHIPWFILVVIASGCATIVITVLLRFFSSSFIQQLVLFFPLKVRDYIWAFNNFRNREVMVPAYLYGILFAVIGLGFQNYMLFLAIGVHIPLMEYFGFIFLISILASLPVSIGNIGVKEWAYVVLFGLLGVSAPAAVTVVIISRVLQMLLSLGALPLYFANKRQLYGNRIS